MDARFYLDPETDLPHSYGHGVTEEEVEQVLRSPGGDLVGTRGSRMKLGRTSAGRYIQVIYSPDEEPGGIFVITALRVDRQGQEGLPAATAGEAAMSDQRLPTGWDPARIREVVYHHDAQDEDERAAEIEAAWEAQGMTLMSVPTELVPEIRAILAREQTA